MIATALTPELSDRMREVLDRLRRDADRLFGTRRVHVAVLTLQVRESSEVARVRITTSIGVRHVFAKIFRPRPGEIGLAAAHTRFRKDYSVTRNVFEAFRETDDLRSVEPIASYEDLLGIVTNEAAGVPLHVLIGRDAAWPTTDSRLAAVELAVSRVGRWIARFQRLAPDAVPSPKNVEAMRQYLDERLKKLTALPLATFDDADRRDVLAYFDRRAGEVPSKDLIDVPVHGDIVPSNVVVAPNAITVIDFGMTARGSRYLDLARLYTQLGFYTAKPHYRPHVIARLQQAALDAFQPGLRHSDPMFEICAVQHVICHLLSHARQPGSFPVSIYSGHQCRRHCRWIRERTRNAPPQRIAHG